VPSLGLHLLQILGLFHEPLSFKHLVTVLIQCGGIGWVCRRRARPSEPWVGQRALERRSAEGIGAKTTQ